MNNQEQAKQFAMNDGGLTEYEADQAIADFNWNIDDSAFCQDCGCKLTKGNTKNITDEICDTCWTTTMQHLKDIQDSI